jgi:tRNA pseudouridine55 synthase
MVHAITPLRVALPDVQIDVRCGKGTYIRSIAHDLGERLGCGAHLTALRRTAVGGFDIAQALTLEQWQAALADGSWPARLLPLDAALLDHLAAVLGTETARRVRAGVPPPLPATALAVGTLCRAYSTDGVLLAILRAAGGERRWRVAKVLVG